MVLADDSVVPKSKLKLLSRDEQLNALKNTPEYDILVIGGGATGAGVALDSVSRGITLNFLTSIWSKLILKSIVKQ